MTFTSLTVSVCYLIHESTLLFLFSSFDVFELANSELPGIFTFTKIVGDMSHMIFRLANKGFSVVGSCIVTFVALDPATSRLVRHLCVSFSSSVVQLINY